MKKNENELTEREIKERTEAVRVLVAARELLHSDGWGQGDYYTKEGPCMFGACLAAMHANTSNSDMHRSEIVEAALVKSTRNESWWDWNDSPRRTKEQVMNALDRAVKTLIE